MPYDLTTIAKKFRIEGNVKNISPYGSGHIHDTYKVLTDVKNYLLQRVNHHVFRNVRELTANIIRISNYLTDKLAATTEEMQILQPITTINGDFFYLDSDGNFWRMFNFIDSSRSYDLVESPGIAFEGGRAYGWFIRMLSEFPVQTLTDTIPRFHDIYYRLENFENSIKADFKHRRYLVQDEIKFVEEHANEMTQIHQLGMEGKIPLRVTHNDTKINNVLFNEDDKCICVIDLDTVMPGYVHFDFGDAIRTFTNTANEDEPDFQKVSFNPELYNAFTRGFLSETKSILNTTEIETLAFSSKLMTFIIGLRFLTDFLDGDVYYKIASPDHNLIRARVQFKLLQSMEEQFEKMNAVVRNEYLS